MSSRGRIINKEAIAAALQAFESTLKTICDKHGWSYPSTSTANPLIDTVMKNGLVPPYLQSEVKSRRSLLEDGLPTLTNRTARHGDGAESKDVPEHVAAYALHMCAANIIFLVESFHALPPTSDEAERQGA